MLLIALLALADALAVTREVEVSPAVVALVRKHAGRRGPELETELAALEAAGDRTAAVMLGELLMMPDRPGGPDYQRSCDHSEKGGQHPEGLHNLATCYFAGSGRPRDLAKARALYGQAAAQGYAQAACAFGNMLIKGEGGPPEVARGLDLCRRAADTGDANAQTDYGGYLLASPYLPKDAVAARRYLSAAAERGQPNAAFLLGQIYYKGDGIAQDVPKAAIWWITAYEKGRKDAAFLIGAAAFKLVVDAAKAKQPVATPILDQAKRWLDVARDEDPSPEKRAAARELRTSLDQLLAGSERVK